MRSICVLLFLLIYMVACEFCGKAGLKDDTRALQRHYATCTSRRAHVDQALDRRPNTRFQENSSEAGSSTVSVGEAIRLAAERQLQRSMQHTTVSHEPIAPQAHSAPHNSPPNPLSAQGSAASMMSVDIPVRAPTSVSQFGRKRYSTASRYVDFIPDKQLPTFLRAPSLPPVLPASSDDNNIAISTPPLPTTSEQSHPHPHPELITEADAFGLQREYYEVPSTNPDQDTTLASICDSPDILVSRPKPSSRWWTVFGSTARPHEDTNLGLSDENGAPFLSPTALLLMRWFYTSSRKTLSDLNALVHDVIFHKDWRRQDLKDFQAQRAQVQYDRLVSASSGTGQDSDSASPGDTPLPFTTTDGWQKGSVRIRLPKERKGWDGGERNAPAMTLDGLWYRKLTEVIKSALQDPASTEQLHLTPFRLFWSSESQPDRSDTPPLPPSPSSPPSSPSHAASTPIDTDPSIPNNNLYDDEPSFMSASLPEDAERIYHEVYTSEAMNREHEKVREQLGSSPHPETVIAAIILYSDSTHLTNFGSASLWPIYIFLGNLSKYTRGKASAFAAHHLAYIPPLPQKILDAYRDIFGTNPSKDVLSHCKRELIHAIWYFLLDADFVHAWNHGMLVMFPDGIERLVFPRIFAYAADYPERVLIACLKFLGTCPCPTCLIKKSRIHMLGTLLGRAAARVDSALRQEHINNARWFIFNKGRNVASQAFHALKEYSWHPIRNAFSGRLSASGFNFYSMFAPDPMHDVELGVWKAIFTHLLRILHTLPGDPVAELDRRFHAIPSFGRSIIRSFGHNASEMKKLAARDFEDLLQCAIPVFEGLIPEPFGSIVMDLLFTVATWHAYSKLRLHTETTLSSMKDSHRAMGFDLRRFKREVCSIFSTKELPREAAARGRREMAKGRPSGGAHIREFKLDTSKIHTLEHYPDAFREIGTYENGATTYGETEHRRSKRFYERTNKRNIEAQIAKQEARVRYARQITQSHGEMNTTGDDVDEESSSVPAHLHHQVPDSTRRWLDLTVFLSGPKTKHDPALRDFYVRFLDHSLRRLKGHSFSGPDPRFSQSERAKLSVTRNRIFSHLRLGVNYTTYDLRRNHDSINPGTQSDVMVLSNEEGDLDDAHPYCYARVIGIYHALVSYGGRSPVRLNFLHVRWFHRDRNAPSGWLAKRLPRISFVPHDQPDAFGFLDPADVVRSVHLIPAFAHDRIRTLPAPSPIARILKDGHSDNKDWRYHYPNFFVDRDMFMRYRGGGVGHRALWQYRDMMETEGHLSPEQAWSSSRATEAAATDDDSMEAEEEEVEEVEEVEKDGQDEDEDGQDEEEEISGDDDDIEVDQMEDIEDEDEDCDEVYDYGYYLSDEEPSDDDEDIIEDENLDQEATF